MTAPTHVAFAVAGGLLFGVSGLPLQLLAGGALLPDIDHPQSTIGRLFFFLSVPLNRYCGHRKTIHGFALWGALTLLGLAYFTPLAWIGAGALSHVLLDCYNVSGVQALMPFSERVCVLFGRNWRMRTGSRNELLVLIIFGCVAWLGGYIGSMGGMRSMIGLLTGSYKIAVQEIQRSGLEICNIDGILRYPSGKTKKGTWLCIGTEGANGVAILVNNKILHIQKDAILLRARVRRTGDKWQAAKVEGFVAVSETTYYYDGIKWRVALPGDIVFGHIIARELKFDELGYRQMIEY